MITVSLDAMELFLQVYHFFKIIFYPVKWCASRSPKKGKLLLLYRVKSLFFTLCLSHQWAAAMLWWSQSDNLRCLEPSVWSRSCGAPASLQTSPTTSYRWAAFQRDPVNCVNGFRRAVISRQCWVNSVELYFQRSFVYRLQPFFVYKSCISLD